MSLRGSGYEYESEGIGTAIHVWLISTIILALGRPPSSKLAKHSGQYCYMAGRLGPILHS